MKPSFVIINGFDRSGTSAITRTLLEHQKLELIMQPFNSGFIRRHMYEPFENSDEVSLGIEFFNQLENGRIEKKMIESFWFEKYSSTLETKEGQVHIIKTTINHFAQRFMIESFENIPVWGIWRNPVDIVQSIMRNGFYGNWYVDGIEEVSKTVMTEPVLKKHYSKFLCELDTDSKRTAFLVAVRSHFFFQYLKKGNVIIYEQFKKDPNYLNDFLVQCGLSKHQFGNKIKDLNIIGRSVHDKSRFVFNENEIGFMDELFKPLIQLKNERL